MNHNSINLHSRSGSPISIASPFRSAGAFAAALCLLAAGTTACSNKTTPTPDKEPSPPTLSSAATVAPTASEAKEEVKTIPLLAYEKFTPAGAHPDSVFGVEGAIMVVEDFRVGRVVDESIEWVGKAPGLVEALGPNRIDAVVGRWPDSIGVLYSNTNGRAQQPTYMPLTGGGNSFTSAPGGGWGDIYGVARIGESTLLAANSGSAGVELTTVRGTVKRKPQTPEQAGCKEGEVWQGETRPPSPAITPKVIESTPEGTLVSIGLLCEKRGPAAEVWDKAGKSRIIDLSRFWKKLSYWAKLLKGKDDEVWALSDGWTPVLHYKNGDFEEVASLGRPIENLFVAPSGKLHASDGKTIHRYEDGKWIPVAQLSVGNSYSNMVMDDKETIWVAQGAAGRLRPTSRTVDLSAVQESCATPFVYLYQVSDKNGDKFTYPSTRKALSTFADVDAIGLVEFKVDYERRLGITVQSKAQGEALIAHLKEAMKEESPQLLCFEPPKDARKIDMKATK